VAKPHAQFTDLQDSLCRAIVVQLNMRERAPGLQTIDAIREAIEQHGLAFAALGAAHPRVFTPGPTVEILEQQQEDPSTRDTSPGFKSRIPPPPPIGAGQPPPLPRGRR
jgi:hypothetical protein